MYHAANYDLIEALLQEYRLAADNNISEITAGLRTNLSNYLRQELDFFCRRPEGNESFQAPLLFLALEHPQLRSVPELIGVLEQLDPRKLLEYLARLAFEEQVPEQLTMTLWHGNVEAGCLETEKLLMEQEKEPRPAVSTFLECLRHPAETQHRLLYLFKGFYEQAYQTIKNELASIGTSAIPRYTMAFQKDPIRFFKQTLKADTSIFTKRVRIHISPLHLASAIMPRPDEEADWIIIDTNSGTYLGPDADWEQLAVLFKALSDKTRLDIVNRLSQRRWYGQELALDLGISAAAVSHHMSFFYHLDVFHVEREGHRYYYSLNRERLEELFEHAKRVILRENHGAYDPA
jgi:DNA-binding transcriptional ArsR family regulator